MKGKADGPEPLLPAGGCWWICVYTCVHLYVCPMCVCVYMGQRGYSDSAVGQMVLEGRVYPCHHVNRLPGQEGKDITQV